MRRRLLSSPCLLLIALAACKVEPPYAPPESHFDAGRADAAAPDAAPLSCLAGERTCPEGTYCSAKDECVAYPSTCTRTSSCAPGLSCAGGRCGLSARGCASGNDCDGPLEVCTAAGYCGPQLSEESPVLPDCTRAVDCDLVQFHTYRAQWTGAARCLRAEDCGPDGVCSAGLCTGCLSSAACPDGLGCTLDTFCVEHAPCSSSDQCYAGNTCTQQLCTRDTGACAVDPANDLFGQATPLEDRAYTGLSICGEDIDWYSIAIPAARGLRLAVTSTPALGGVLVDITDSAQSLIGDLGRLDLPGLTVVELPLSNEARTVFVRLVSADSSVPYDLDVRFVSALCAGDGLDLYGDGAGSPLVLAANHSYQLRACSGDLDRVQVRLEAGDQLVARADFDAGTELHLTLLDSGGGDLTAARTTSATSEEARSAPVSAGGLYTVQVSTVRGPSAGGTYLLRLSRATAARLQACAAAPMPLRIGTTTLSGSLAGARDVGGPPSCELYPPLSRHDVLYALQPESVPGVIEARVRQTNGPSTATVSVALLSSCGDDVSVPLACDASPRPLREASFLVQRDTRDPVYLLVSSDGLREDVEYSVELDYFAAGAPPNDTCAAATEIAASTVLSASTFGAARNAQLEADGVCGLSGSGAGPDRFYRLSLASGERAALELTGPAGGYLWVGTDCAQLTTTCTAAATIGFGSAAQVTLTPRSAANYYVAVDGPAAGDAGLYTLRAVRGADLGCLRDSECAPSSCDDYTCRPPPPNDACPGTVVPLPGGRAVVQGSTGAARDDYRLSCATQGGQRDVVYQISVPAGVRAINARITQASWDPILAIRPGSCGAVNAERCNDDVRYPDQILPEVSFPNPAPGDYWIVVDAYDGRGPFELTIELEQ